MQCVPTRLGRDRNMKLAVTEFQEARVRKYLKRKLLQRCRERARVSRQNILSHKRNAVIPSQLLEEETPLQDTISEKSFVDSLTEKEYEEWMLTLERALQEDLIAEQEEQDQIVAERKALEELEYERQLFERYGMFIER